MSQRFFVQLPVHDQQGVHRIALGKMRAGDVAI